MGSQFPLRECKIPLPRKSQKILKDYNLAHPGHVLKITEK